MILTRLLIFTRTAANKEKPKRDRLRLLVITLLASGLLSAAPRMRSIFHIAAIRLMRAGPPAPFAT
ncbi:hypothetical protein [Rhizobium sp. RAF56]|uniref:hypothetical protein n=1 Tax=Rhizobium sp. RAF56 TaxID=3233062 RepID=UPI003F965472